MPAPGSMAVTPTEVGALATRLPAGIRLSAMVPRDARARDLHPLESLLMTGESNERRQQFAAGRHCAHAALVPLRTRSAPLLRRRDGAPDWPLGVRGSISHKGGLCVAVVGSSEDLVGIGIDVEANRALPAPVWGRVFTPAELRRLNVLPPADRAVRARLCFSAKECYYKWYRSQGGRLEPDFGDVEVEVIGDSLHVRATSRAALPTVQGCFAQGDDWLITVLWSYATPARRDPAPHTQDKNQLEVDQHGNTHSSPVHA